MNVWLPYIEGGSGTDVFVNEFARHLGRLGHRAFVQRFPHSLQIAPEMLGRIRPPVAAEVVLTNSWHGFAFRHAHLPMIAVAHLCVHHPSDHDYRTRAQRAYHKRIRRLEERSFATADCVVAVSQATRRDVVRSFPGVDPVIVPNGIDTEFFTPGVGFRPRLEDEPFRLLFVGNLTRRKGADLLEGILEDLGSGFELTYTSGDRSGVRLRSERAMELGTLDRAGVRKAMRSSHALLFPTRLEGMALTVLESMACGLPVVGSDNSSMPEVVIDGETGLLRPLDVRQLADAVRILASNEKLRRSMVMRSRERAMEHHDGRLMVRRYLSIFEGMMNRL